MSFSVSNDNPARVAAVDGVVSKVSLAARGMDALLAVVGGVLAYRAEASGAHWLAICWGVGSAFCVFTAIIGPVDKIWAFGNRKLLGRRERLAASAVPAQVIQPLPVNRQQRREQARRASKG